mgnify:CR=1 FL=1
MVIFLFIFGIVSPKVYGETDKCVGRFLNPINDICWSCLFPITIGSVPIINSSKFKDTENPSLPVCLCNRKGIPLPGLTIGFWEPVRIAEVTRIPGCLVSLGGIKISTLNSRMHGNHKKAHREESNHNGAFYHVHYYVYPVLFLLNLIADFGCMDKGSYDVVYMSEFDPSHQSDKLANFLNPETFLLANPVSQMACAVDCVKATMTKQSVDSLFWCSGCQGSIYPLSGYTSTHIGGVATSSLMTTRELAKLHRGGLAKKTATSSSAINGELCESSYAWRIPKTQYRIQMTYPRVNANGPYSCNPIGMSDLTYGAGREFPYSGEDFVYMIWRKRNCCLF